MKAITYLRGFSFILLLAAVQSVIRGTKIPLPAEMVVIDLIGIVE